MSFQIPDSQFLAKSPVFRAASRQRRGCHRGTGGLVNGKVRSWGSWSAWTKRPNRAWFQIKALSRVLTCSNIFLDLLSVSQNFIDFRWNFGRIFLMTIFGGFYIAAQHREDRGKTGVSSLPWLPVAGLPVSIGWPPEDLSFSIKFHTHRPAVLSGLQVI